MAPTLSTSQRRQALLPAAIGGSTLHSFAGIGLGEGSPEVLLARVKSKRELRRRWETAKALVIDEISMIDGPLMVRKQPLLQKKKKKKNPKTAILLAASLLHLLASQPSPDMVP